MNEIIGVDVDDVMLQTVEHWLDLYNYAWQDTLLEDDIKTWSIADYVKPECGNAIYNYLSWSGFYHNIKSVAGAIGGVRELQSMGYRVIFVTAVSPKPNIHEKLRVLRSMGLEVPDKNYFEVKDKSLVACDYLIDDRPANVVNAFGQGILFNRAWNADVTGYPRVYNWNEIINYFRLDK